jgi:hypothetical protein
VSTGNPQLGGDNRNEQRSASPSISGSTSLPDIADLETQRVEAPEVPAVYDEVRRVEVARHHARAHQLRADAAAFDEDIAHASLMIDQLQARLDALRALPATQRSNAEASEMDLLFNLIPDHVSLRAYLRDEQCRLRSRAAEHERAARWLERTTG